MRAEAEVGSANVLLTVFLGAVRLSSGNSVLSIKLAIKSLPKADLEDDFY